MLDDSPTRVLVTGGCGYIGSHAVAEVLRHTRAEVVVVDDLSNSPREVVDALAEAGGRGLRFHGVDICDGAGLRRALRGYDGFDAVLHFAARKSVPESLADPLGYYANNVGGMIELLDYARGAGVRALVFSSSCIVYGDAAALPVCETAPPGAPRSPYGHTKQLDEQLLRLAPGMRRIGLRYFNPAGADNSGLLGDRGEGTYVGLAKVLCRAAQTGAPVRVFGADYPRPTAPAYATTCTSPTSPRPTWLRSRGRSSPARRPRSSSSTSAASAATASARPSRPSSTPPASGSP